ncbi:hypothetical protein M422DRAFT_247243 [Sphaerobolus stellatus SS14]|nr:hypothetical protein M422DRAFT_247243 [Sphaerobolus stellatus SS14]
MDQASYVQIYSMTINLWCLRHFHRDFIALIKQFKLAQEAATATAAVGTVGSEDGTVQQKAKSSIPRPPRDEDYWSSVTAFFEEKIKLWSKDMKVGGRSIYIAETMALERAAFPRDPLASLSAITAPTTPQFQPDLPYKQMPQMPGQPVGQMTPQMLGTPFIGTGAHIVNAPSTPRPGPMGVARFLNN